MSVQYDAFSHHLGIIIEFKALNVIANKITNNNFLIVTGKINVGQVIHKCYTRCYEVNESEKILQYCRYIFYAKTVPLKLKIQIAYILEMIIFTILRVNSCQNYMRKCFFTGLLLTSLMACSGIFAQQTGDTLSLYDEKDLSNWKFYLQPTDTAVDPSGVFHAVPGAILITGMPFGYMRSPDAYSDYQLHLEWRWPREAGNSGVFIHAQPEDAIWPSCFECQLKAGSAGDIVFMGGTSAAEQQEGMRIKSKLQESSEKPVGEWNTLFIICRGNTIEIEVNGVLQNRITGTSLSEGNICLQSEGSYIEFRNVTIIKKD